MEGEGELVGKQAGREGEELYLEREVELDWGHCWCWSHLYSEQVGEWNAEALTVMKEE